MRRCVGRALAANGTAQEAQEQSSGEAPADCFLLGHLVLARWLLSAGADNKSKRGLRVNAPESQILTT